MAVDQTRYRQLDFIGARILEARELNWLQEMAQGIAVTDNETSVDGQLQAIIRQGASYNTKVTTTGLVVTLSKTDVTKPMQLFIRDRWETFPGINDDITDTLGVHSGNSVITLTGSQTTIYLNWELKIRTGGLTGDDPTLTDSTTNEAVASAGELIIHLGTTDTSGASLTGSQLAKNTSAIPLFTFTNSGSSLTYVPKDNIFPQALASSTTSGLVSTTTTNPIVVSTDDSRMSNSRGVVDGSVHDSSVRTPVAFGGTNGNGTTVYKLPTDGGTDIGGISAAKVVLISTKQLLEDGWNWLVTQFNSLSSSFFSHYTAALGLSNTHPIPTASQVGAAPASHVGLPLGLSTSHPPIVNQNSGGFQVNRTDSNSFVDDPAFGVFVTGTPIASLNHDGDVGSSKAQAFVANPGGALASGSLRHMSLIAQVLSQHVNQISHANPHGLAASDIGAATTSYVDTSSANALATAEGYTNAQLSAGFAISKAPKGYIQLPTVLGGLIVQWTTGVPIFNGDNTQTVTFPIAFPTACLTVQTSTQTSSTNIAKAWGVISYTRTNVTVILMRRGDEGSYTETPIILAIGY